MSRISLASFYEMATTSTPGCRRTPGMMSILLKDVADGLPTSVLCNVVCLLIFNPARSGLLNAKKEHVIRSQDYNFK